MACKFIFFTTTNGKTYLLAIPISYLRVRFKIKGSKLVFLLLISVSREGYSSHFVISVGILKWLMFTHYKDS